MNEQQQEGKPKKKENKVPGGDSGGLIWFLGTIGALVYYIQQAESFVEGSFGVLKALMWPAMLVYKLLGL